MQIEDFDWNLWLPRDLKKVWPKALTIAGACLATLVVAGWALFLFGYARGKDINEGELNEYKTAREAKLPEVTAGLGCHERSSRFSAAVSPDSPRPEVGKRSVGHRGLFPSQGMWRGRVRRAGMGRVCDPVR